MAHRATVHAFTCDVSNGESVRDVVARVERDLADEAGVPENSEPEAREGKMRST